MFSTIPPLLITLIAIIFMFRRIDVRLNLGLCGAGLFLIAGKFPPLNLVKLVAIPLLAGLAVLLVAAVFNLI